MAKMPNFLNSVKVQRPPRNRFDMSYDYKTTFDMGEMIPVCNVETLPGDTWQIGGSALVRFAPLIAPVMHKLYQRIHYFFVPNRLTYDRWDDFITANPDGNPPAAPTVTITGAMYNQYPLINYLGLPDPGTFSYTVSAIPFAAYQMVYNEYYRDQNQIVEVNYNLVPGDNSLNTDLFVLRFCAWEHDLFTSALPTEQWGQTVDIPIGDANVQLRYPGPFGSPMFVDDNGDPVSGAVTAEVGTGALNVDGNNAAFDPFGTLHAVVEPTTINSLRRAFSLQRWAEVAMRVGRRLVEATFGHFGVKSSDARLQRPEYIVGVKENVIISEVLNTTGEVAEGGLPQGTMAGHGVSVAKGSFGTYFCEEWGFIVGIMTVVPETAYSQGIPNHFNRSDKFDYYWPELANIGEAAVPIKEIYVQVSDQDAVFGYMPQYYGYRYNQSRITGEMKTTYEYWHFGRKFATTPGLNQGFIECKPTKGPFAVQDPDVDSLIVHVRNTMFATRLVNKFGTPI